MKSVINTKIKVKKQKSQEDVVNTNCANEEIFKQLSQPVEVGTAKKLIQGGAPGLPEWAWHL